MSASADAAKKARTSLDADMEISAIETLSDAMLNTDMALQSANTTLHWTNSEPDIESEAVAKRIRTKSLNDNRVRPEVYEHDVGHTK